MHRSLFESLDGLVGDADPDAPLDGGKSGALVQRIVVDGRPHVLKRQRRSDDWIMRALGDEQFWTWHLWESGMAERIPLSEADPLLLTVGGYAA